MKEKIIDYLKEIKQSYTNLSKYKKCPERERVVFNTQLEIIDKTIEGLNNSEDINYRVVIATIMAVNEWALKRQIKEIKVLTPRFEIGNNPYKEKDFKHKVTDKVTGEVFYMSKEEIIDKKLNE